MPGYLAIILHAHLPFVRHPEHERFLEESWFYEAVAECYLPLIRILEGWQRDALPARITLNLSPTLCCMLSDPLLQSRCQARLAALIELAEKEVLRTAWQPALNQVARFYEERFRSHRGLWEKWGGDLISAFRQFEQAGLIEITTNSATHAVLPLLASHAPSLRAQVLTACDHFRGWFGHHPAGFWLPECAYSAAVEKPLREADIRWTVVEAHGIHLANPRPFYGVYAPVVTPTGLAVFGRDTRSAQQVWSRTGGYPGDPRYREFYRDIGYDLDLDYVDPHLPCPGQRGFTGIKYHRITGATEEKEIYDREVAARVTQEHATHFVEERLKQTRELAGAMDRPPIVVCPYDAELFGHWWFEGPEWLDAVVRRACASGGELKLVTPSDYLRRHPANALSQPAASSWGEEGHLRVWLNQKNHAMHAGLSKAQEQMSELARRIEQPTAWEARVLAQAARELLLAQSSDWAFMLHVGGNEGYPRQRFAQHLQNFTDLQRALVSNSMKAEQLERIERSDNCFDSVDWRHWR